MRSLFVVLPLLAACPAPDAIDFNTEVDPTIELLYPPASEPLIRATDGSVSFLVVVDIDGIVFDHDLAGEPAEDGIGHYHLWLNETHIGSPADLSQEVSHLSGVTPDLSTASEVHVRVTLQNNDHSDYDVDADGNELPQWEAIVAYTIVDET